MTSLIMSSPPISISHRLSRCRYSNSKDVVASSPSFPPPPERPGELALRLVVFQFSFATLETEGKWNELTFAKISGTVTRDREKKLASSWPARPGSNYGTHFSSSALILSIEANNGVKFRKIYDKKGKFIVTVNVLYSYLLTLGG